MLKIFSWPPDICIYLRLSAIFDLRSFYFEARGCLKFFEKLWAPNQIQPVGRAGLPISYVILKNIIWKFWIFIIFWILVLCSVQTVHATLLYFVCKSHQTFSGSLWPQNKMTSDQKLPSTSSSYICQEARKKLFSILGPKLSGSKAQQYYRDKILQIRVEGID